MKIKFSILLLVLIFVPAEAFSQITRNTVLQGRLLKSDGKPLPYTEIELVPVESSKLVINSNLIATGNSSGKFIFSNVPSGKYTLSINFDDKPTDLSPYPTFYYPNTEKREHAEVFEVKNPGFSRNIIFKLPPALPQKKIMGKVTLKNGDAVKGAYIFIRDMNFDKSFAIGNLLSDKNGEFSVRGFEGRKYQVGAMLYSKPIHIGPDSSGELLAATETDIFELQKPVNLNLVLGRDDGFEQLPNKYIAQLFWLNETFQNQKH